MANANETRNKKLLRWSREIWREENARIFNGKLSRPHFAIQKMADAKGLWKIENQQEKIIIDPTYCKTKKVLRNVMVHEMVHQLQWQQKSERTRREMHGRFFQYHCIRILINFDLSIETP